MEVLLYICIFFCGWVCHSFFSYIMSLGYSVMLLRNLLRDIVYMMARVVEVAYLIHEIKMIELSRASLSDKERENHVKLHEIQMGNLKRDIVGSITRNFPKSFNNLIEFHDWDSMIKWIDKELKINKEIK
mgnify:FL=1